jgi:hypothetical protein
MIPVIVRQQDREDARLTAEFAAETDDTGARIENDGAAGVLVGDFEARGVAPVPNRGRDRPRHRPAHAPEA